MNKAPPGWGGRLLDIFKFLVNWLMAILDLKVSWLWKYSQGDFLDAIASQEMDMSVTQAFPAYNEGKSGKLRQILNNWGKLGENKGKSR